MPAYLKYVMRLAFKERKRVGLLLALTAAGALVRVAIPLLWKAVFDVLAQVIAAKAHTPSEVLTIVIALACWALLTLLSSNYITASRRWYLRDIGYLTSQRVHMDGYLRLQRLDYAEHHKYHSSEYTKIVDDADSGAFEMVSWWLDAFTSSFLGFAGALAIALVVSWPMAIAAVAVVPPSLWFIVKYVAKCRRKQFNADEMWMKKHAHLAEEIRNIATYKLNPDRESFTRRHAGYVERAALEQLGLNKEWRVADLFVPNALAYVLVTVLGVALLLRWDITLGTLVMFEALLVQILEPLDRLNIILPRYSRCAGHLERFLALLAQPDAVTVPERPALAAGIKGVIRFDRVSFSYEGKVPALREISFEAKFGETTALVGRSGSGKTTIMLLLTHLIEPSGGSVTIDGTDVRDYDPEDLMRRIGTVLQDNAMYDATIAENIAISKARATREEIVRAAKLAHAHEYIEMLPDGYETKVGESGCHLSGGERQRLAIARAMLKNPPIVVLDEPTSALDSITEMNVQRGLDELSLGRTTLVIAHRLSTVRNARQIIVLDQGKMVARGTHAELVRSCPLYQAMVKLQANGLLGDF
ncbi:MAG: ABC transporter ATP-binding protein [Patescibacteria group bacterium]|nr:ABC transporter ATP-binding protein [Patescibacteria group bacterium]